MNLVLYDLQVSSHLIPMRVAYEEKKTQRREMPSQTGSGRAMI